MPSLSLSCLKSFSACELFTRPPTHPIDFKTQTAHGSALPANVIF